MTGSIPGGERLRIGDLAGRFGVSTMPVREALLTLAGEGLVEGEPHRGMRVVPISAVDVEDVFYVHAAIAGRLAARAATTMSDADLERLHDIQNRIEGLSGWAEGSSPDFERVEELNFEFHRLINRAGEGRRLRWFLRSTTRYVPRQLFETVPGWIETSAADHPKIIEALERRDAHAAEQATRRHFENGGMLVVAHLRRTRGEGLNRARRADV